MSVFAIIMAGGAGTRFWPASRANRPKQLLDLSGDRTMIQATVDRLGDCAPPERTFVITNRRLVEPLREQLPQLPAGAIIGEPCKRDTAPCVGLAAVLALHHDPEATLVVMPADHVIDSPGQFQAALRQAVSLVDQRPERMVTFGIRPTYAAETFGYIEKAEPLSGDTAATFRVQKFHEKPQQADAQRYLATGNFLWNSGIFVWRASTVLAALKQFEPAMHARLETIARALGTPDYEATLEREFSAIVGKSIDYAVMEKYPETLVIEAPFQWDDLGSWQSLARLRGVDAQNNTLLGRCLALETTGTIVRTSPDHLVVTVGLADCIVVHTADATLVARRSHEESLRQVVAALEQRGWKEFL